jgi:aspartyl-tRNA(Asn)/glutamyl-tRNA(Gln) amidotransferase subunit A
VEVDLPLLEEALGAHRAIIFPEASSFHRPFLAERAADYADDIRPLLLSGLFMPTVDYLDALRARRIIRREWAKVFEVIDVLVTPTTPVTATKFGDVTADVPGGPKPLVRAYLDLTLPFNLTGYPAISIPCGFSKAGLPIGMQIVGRPFTENTLLRVAHQYQQETDWHDRMPASVK